MSVPRERRAARLFGALALVVLSGAAPSAASSPPLLEAPPGLHLETGSIARQPIVAVGRSVEVDG